MLTKLRLAKERPELRVVDDQTGAPTWCRSLAEITAQIFAQLCVPGNLDAERASGTYHVTSSGRVSWHGFAAAILSGAEVKPMPRLVAIPSREYPTLAIRPKNSELSNEKLSRTFGLAASPWQDNLHLCLEEMRR